MLSNNLPSPAVLVCFALFIVILWRISARWHSPAARDEQASLRPAPTFRHIFPALVCAFLCTVGVLFLIPWTSPLYTADPFSWTPAVIFAGLLSVGAFWALSRRGDRQ